MKNITIKRERKCRICKSSSQVQNIFELMSTPIADYYSIIKLDNLKKYELSLKFCKCEFVEGKLPWNLFSFCAIEDLCY